MCRLAALPPGTSPDAAYSLLKTLEQYNKDGVGVGYYDNENRPVTKKYPISVSEALALRVDLFSHMPHTGWTIMHTRLGTHGQKAVQNTHPFVIGNYIFCHNGTWNDDRLARHIISGFDNYKWEGQTDSEVAGYLFNQWGPELFTANIPFGGVFMGLHNSGELHICKSTGDLELLHTEPNDVGLIPTGKVVVASEFDDSVYEGARECDFGQHLFNADGTVKSMPKPKEKVKWFGYPAHGYGYGGRQRGYPTEDEFQHALDHYEKGQNTANSSPVQTVLFPHKDSKVSADFWSLDPDNFQVVLVDGK